MTTSSSGLVAWPDCQAGIWTSTFGSGLRARHVRLRDAANESFQQRIAGETIGPVQPSAGHFAHGIQAGDIGLAVHIGHDAAALIMRGGNHGDRFFGDVDAVLQAGRIDVRKPLAEELGGLERNIQEHTVRAALLHLVVDCARDDVAGRERFERMVFVHELHAIAILQNAALATDGFADQERFGFRVIKARGMELDEFHVGDARSGSIGHGHAVAGGDIRVGRVEINFSATARGQQDRTGPRTFPPRRFLSQRT